MDDSVLISSSLQGDLDAFNRLVLAYQDQVYRQAFYLLGDTQTADDATQEAFLVAFLKLRTFRGGSFKGWLLRIVANVSLDEIRRQKRQRTTALEPANCEGEGNESPDWLVDPGSQVEDRIERADLCQVLQRCLNRLPEEYRGVVVLVDVQGLGYAETAQILGIPLGTMKSRLARGRARLRRQLPVVLEERKLNGSIRGSAGPRR